jgi:hypothetical protein
MTYDVFITQDQWVVLDHSLQPDLIANSSWNKLLRYVFEKCIVQYLLNLYELWIDSW